MKNLDFEFLEKDGPLILKPSKIIDKRGYFIKDFIQDSLNNFYPDFSINETFFSFSFKNVFRGFHFQILKPQIKIVSCLKGKIIDFAIDIRPKSKFFKKIYQLELSSENFYSFVIPKGFAHGFLALQDSMVSYKCSGVYIKDYDSGLKYNDPSIGLNLDSFGINEKNLIFSDRDLNFKSLDEIISSLDF